MLSPVIYCVNVFDREASRFRVYRVRVGWGEFHQTPGNTFWSLMPLWLYDGNFVLFLHLVFCQDAAAAIDNMVRTSGSETSPSLLLEHQINTWLTLILSLFIDFCWNRWIIKYDGLYPRETIVVSFCSNFMQLYFVLCLIDCVTCFVERIWAFRSHNQSKHR